LDRLYYLKEKNSYLTKKTVFNLPNDFDIFFPLGSHINP
jgi:hypothetical protein